MQYSRPETNAFQCTLDKPVRAHGFGLQDGEETSLTLTPAPPDSGIHFLRRDVDITRAVIPARWDMIVETQPDTLLSNEHGIGAHGVEPLLAALRGCGVDNVLIEIDGYEVPGFDGSSAELLQMIEQAGIVEQPVARQVIWMDKIVAVRIGEHYACIMPAMSPSITVDVAGTEDSLPSRALTFSLLDHVFAREIAPARHPLQVQADHDPATDSPTYANSEGASFADEVTRFRVLESLGMLALAELPIYGQVYLYNPNAFLLDALLHKLFSERDCWSELSYAEVEQMTGKPSTNSHQRLSDRRIVSADKHKVPAWLDPGLQ